MSLYYRVVKRYFEAGYYTADMVRKFVRYKYITEEEFEEICGEPYAKEDEI